MTTLTLTGGKQVINVFDKKTGALVAVLRTRGHRKKNGRKKLILVGPLALAGKRGK